MESSVKTCRKCGQSKPFEKFNKAKKKPDGHHPWCKACQASYYKNTKTEPCKINYGNENLAKDMEKLKHIQSYLSRAW